MFATVALHRLDRIKFRDASGKRGYTTFDLPPADFAAIQKGMLQALGLGGLIRHV